MTDPNPIALHGVIPPIMTPLDSQGDLDLASLDRLTAFLLESGVDGLFVLGSSGEAAYLTDQQRRLVVDRVVGQIAGQANVLVGLVDTTPARVMEQGRQLLKPGVCAAVVTAPFYANLACEEIVGHFVDVAAALDVPVLAYNIPPNVHQALDVESLAELSERGAIIGVKDSSGDLASLRSLLARPGRQRPQVVLTGSEMLLDLALMAGADGTVAGLSNVDPVSFVSLVRAHRASDAGEVAVQQQRIQKLTGLYARIEPATGTNAVQLGGMKLALHLRGVISSPRLSAPMAHQSERQHDHAREILLELCLI